MTPCGRPPLGTHLCSLSPSTPPTPDPFFRHGLFDTWNAKAQMAEVSTMRNKSRAGRVPTPAPAQNRWDSLCALLFTLLLYTCPSGQHSTCIPQSSRLGAKRPPGLNGRCQLQTCCQFQVSTSTIMTQTCASIPQQPGQAAPVKKQARVALPLGSTRDRMDSGAGSLAPTCLIEAWEIRLVQRRRLRDQRVVWIRVAQQTQYRQKHLADC